MAESEYILLKRFSTSGDAEAFAQIIQQHAPMVYGVCLRILANREIAADVVQDTFFQLVRDAAEITDSIPNWLHKVATHRAIDIVRSDSQRKQREMKYASNPGNIDSEDNKAAWREISVCIDEELENLDEQTKEILILRFFQGQTMTDIAENIGVSQPTVSRWIEAGIELLRQKLKSRGVIVPAAVFITLLNENIVQAAPASIMKELGKIAIAGSRAATGAKISTGIAIKAKIFAVSTAAIFTIGSIILYINYALAAEREEIPPSQTATVTIPSVDELLDNYTKALDSIQSFIASTEYTTNRNNFLRGEYRTDGKGKASATSYRWGFVGMNEPNTPESKAVYIRYVANDDFMYHHASRLNITEYNGREFHGRLTYLTPDSGEEFQLTRDSHGTFNHDASLSYFLGYFDNRARLDTTLKNEAKHISVRPEPEIINGSVCFVVEAETKRGKITVWLDSEHGYHPARIKVKMGTGDNAGDPGSPRILTKEDEAEYTLDNVRFEKVEGLWVPMEADSIRHVIQGIVDSSEGDQTHFKFTKITLNPDHVALNSFGNPTKNPKLDPELVDGTIVYQTGYESATWKNGKVIDSYGHEIDLDNRGPKVVVGHALPDLSEFNVNLDPQAVQNRMLLICLWDRDQRPSRNAILSLNKQAEALLEKDLYMVFIHAGEVQERAFTSWLQRNEILPPVGVCNSGLPELENTWGVKSLPWLILTDKNHVVTNEGFSIDELNEKIN